MKRKLTITVDTELISMAKRYARTRGVSLSSLVEQSLREMTRGETPSFFLSLARQVSGGPARKRPTLRRVSQEIPPMMLLDTDVLIDVALDRHPYSESASELLDRLEHGRKPWHSLSNLYYIVLL